MKKRQFSGAGGVSLAADAGGDPSHPCVVLLHGGGQTRFSWGKAAHDLVAMGYYVVSVDLRGHGESGWAPDGDYRTDAFVDDLHALIEQLPGRPALVGASLGGITSLIAIGETARPVASALVLVDVVPRLDQNGTREIRGFMAANPQGFASVAEAADAVTRFLPHRPRPPSVEGLKKNLRLAPDGRFYWHWDPAMIHGQRPLDASGIAERLCDAARNVRAPTLLVRGLRSNVVSQDGADELLRLIPGCEIVEVKGAGHMVAGDKNDRFNDSVESFLRRTIRIDGQLDRVPSACA
ncbi:alpha/beta hydrolase [Azoarcus sp. DN11]|uniref:alpha/beta fold hydrolase n=1 Tax=Azoarcus sp. DN11 TaxID=356837 RepID=UPI000EAF85E3|nr:alpha/beta hydrolase [Azoarcus sp. DN11]AYH43539.1 alpha/beta hydrolase [Azoarcus sp. DN11]